MTARSRLRGISICARPRRSSRPRRRRTSDRRVRVRVRLAPFVVLHHRRAPHDSPRRAKPAWTDRTAPRRIAQDPVVHKNAMKPFDDVERLLSARESEMRAASPYRPDRRRTSSRRFRQRASRRSPSTFPSACRYRTPYVRMMQVVERAKSRLSTRTFRYPRRFTAFHEFHRDAGAASAAEIRCDDVTVRR